MLIDYHLHNHFSADSESETADIAKKAVELGINEICVTNHVENFDPKTGAGDFSYREAMSRFKKIKKEIGETQKKFPDLPIKFGIELEYVPRWMNEMKKFINDTGFDFLIGSVHEVDDVIVSSSDLCRGLYEKTDEEHAYGRYFDLLFEMVNWGQFSVVGHFDICKKGGMQFYGSFRPQKYKDKIMEILKLIKQKGIGIELNTSGLRYDCREIFPHPDILKWAVGTGIEHFTLGSDAHKAEDVGKGLNEALAIAKETGIKNLSTYKNRIPTQFNI